MALNKNCIINVGIGGWYPSGTQRLRDTTIEYLNNIDILTWSDILPEGARSHKESNYGFKTYAFREAFAKGYENVLWCDSSIYAIKDIHSIFEKLNKDGHYFIDNGFSLAETATDRLLNFESMSRLEASSIPELTTCVFGITEKVLNVYLQWLIYEQNDLFNGSRTHDPKDSGHPMFKFCRHDQSALSLAAYKFKVKPNGKYGEFVSYEHKGNGAIGEHEAVNESVCLLNCGM